MDPFNEVIEIIANIDSPSKMKQFLKEILTDKERNDIGLRWQLMKELYEGDTQRAIASRHKISLCKITRGSKILKARNSYTKSLLDRQYQENQ